MTEGRTYWYAEDATYLSRALVIELGEEFGPAVPGVLQSMKGHAKLQNDNGRVTSGLATVNRESFAGDVERCRRIIERAAEIGLLDDLEWRDDGRRFTCRLSGWNQDQGRGYETVRKRWQRDSPPPQGDEPGQCPEEPGQVPPSPSTGQDRTEKTPQTPRGDSTVKQAQANGFDEWLLDHATVTSETPPKASTKLYAELAGMFNGRIDDGLTLADLKLATRGAFNDTYRRENGYFNPKSILRPTKCLELVNKGKRLGNTTNGPTSLAEFKRQQWPHLYGDNAEGAA